MCVKKKQCVMSLLVFTIYLLAILSYLCFRCICYNGTKNATLAYDGFSYVIHLRPKHWLDAQLSCRATESRLPEIDSPHAVEELISFIMKCKRFQDKSKIPGYWLDGKQNGTKWRSWEWSKNASVGWRWHIGISTSKHNHIGSQSDCMELQFVNKSNMLLAWNNVVSCKEERPYICQRPNFM